MKVNRPYLMTVAVFSPQSAPRMLRMNQMKKCFTFLGRVFTTMWSLEAEKSDLDTPQAARTEVLGYNLNSEEDDRLLLGRMPGVTTCTTSSNTSSASVALETLQYLRKVVLHEKYDTIKDLIGVLTSHGRWLCQVLPAELVIRNVVMMILKLARDESFRVHMGEPSPAFDSLNKLWIQNDDKSGEGTTSGKKLKKGLMQAVNEVASEMSLCSENIAARASDLVNPQDVVIVHGLRNSSTLAAFIDAARNTRKHRVLTVVHSKEADSEPEWATPIQLRDIGSKICEATKVLLPCSAVFPDGSCLVPAGGLSICLSAQRHSVPVYVLAAFFKITPFFFPDLIAVNPYKAPGVAFSHSTSFVGLVEIPRPTFDLIPASLVTLYVSNSACILPSHVYRLIGDYYHPDDVAER